MEKYYYLKGISKINDIQKEKIISLKESEFYLRFGGAFEHILSNFCISMFLEKNIEIPFEKKETIFFMDFINNWNKYKQNWSDLEAISFYDLSPKEQQKINNKIDIPFSPTPNNKKQTQKSKKAGNGEGSLCFNESLQKWEYYYYNTYGERKVIRQKKNEKTKEFKDRVTTLKTKINNGTYIEKRKDTVVSLVKEHIEKKHKNGITSDRSYLRDLEILKELELTCDNFCTLPIQKVTLQHIEDAKDKMKQKYSNSVIDKIWSLLFKAFSIASSPSRKILEINIMNDEELVKPISDKKTKKVKPLKYDEFEKLLYILDNEEKKHKYRNTVKMQCISGMRISEVLARSKDDYNAKDLSFNVHNTLTLDKNGNIILGKHTKTYNKKTEIDEGQRYLPLDNDIFIELKEIIEEELKRKISNINKLLFWNYSKNTFVTYNEINSWLERINKKYNICDGNLSSHRIRHTVLTIWYHVKKIPLKDIQYLAGHVEGSSITEGVYIETSFEDVKKSLKNLKAI